MRLSWSCVTNVKSSSARKVAGIALISASVLRSVAAKALSNWRVELPRTCWFGASVPGGVSMLAKCEAKTAVMVKGGVSKRGS
jgi:hypothetical protein